MNFAGRKNLICLFIRIVFSVLASDGLWDTHSNEDAVATVKFCVHKERLMGADTLAREAFNKGSLDKITVVIIDLKRLQKK